MGWIVVVVVVVVVAVVGVWRLLTDGRFRGTHQVKLGSAEPVQQIDGTDEAEVLAVSVLADTPWADELGERATLLQFSSAFCAPCRATRRVLADIVAIVPGVAHIEVDAEHHLDVVRRLGILRTPTTLVLDADGRERSRASGAPTKQAVIASLGTLVSD